MKYLRLVLITVTPVVIILLMQSPGMGQTLGNPVMLKSKSWSVGISADRIKYELKNHEYLSVRGLLNASFSVNDVFDLTLLAGMGNMNIRYPDERARTNFDAKNSLAIGGSAKIYRSVPEIDNVRLMGEIGVLRFMPIGHSFSTLSGNDADYYQKFDWREYWLTLGTIFSYNQYDIYAGYQGRKIQQIEVFSDEEYVSGLQSGFVAGVNFNLPAGYAFNLQFRTINGSAVSIGVSQSISY